MPSFSFLKKFIHLFLLTRAVAGRAPASPPAARAHGRSAAARPRRPAAARFWGRALLPRGFPGGPGRGSRGPGRGRGKGLGKEGKRERKGGNQTRKGRKGGRGKIRRGRKAQSPPPAAACALRQHVRRGRHRVPRSARRRFLCAPRPRRAPAAHPPGTLPRSLALRQAGVPAAWSACRTGGPGPLGASVLLNPSRLSEPP